MFLSTISVISHQTYFIQLLVNFKFKMYNILICKNLATYMQFMYLHICAGFFKRIIVTAVFTHSHGQARKTDAVSKHFWITYNDRIIFTYGKRSYSKSYYKLVSHNYFLNNYYKFLKFPNSRTRYAISDMQVQKAYLEMYGCTILYYFD